MVPRTDSLLGASRWIIGRRWGAGFCSSAKTPPTMMIVVPPPPPPRLRTKKDAATFKIANLENFMMILFGSLLLECSFSNNNNEWCSSSIWEYGLLILMLKEEVAPNFDKLLIIRLVLQEDSRNFAKPQDFQQEQCVHIGPIEHSGGNSSNFAKPNGEPVGARGLVVLLQHHVLRIAS